MLGSSGQSRILRIAWMNILLGLVLVAVFVSSTSALSDNLRREREQQTRLTAENFAENFIADLEHVSNNILLYRKESAFIMAMSGYYTEWSDLKDYTERAIDSMSILQSSIPAVSRVILASPHVGFVLNGSGIIYRENLYGSDWFKKVLAPDETLPDLFSLEEGWYFFQNFALYAQPSYSNSVFMAIVNPKLMADLDTFSATHSGQHVVVLDAQGNYLTSSLSASKAAEFKASEGGEECRIGGVDYSVYHHEELGYRFLLLTDVHTLENTYGIINISAACVVLFSIVLLSLMTLNSSYLARIHCSLGHDKGRTDEIQRISRMVQERSQYHRREIERLLGALAGGGEMPASAEPVFGMIGEAYDRYFLLNFAAEDAQGAIAGDQFRQLKSFLCDHFDCSGVCVDEFQAVYIIERVPECEQLEDILYQFCASLPGELRAYAGVSACYTDSKMIRRAYEQAHARMLRAPVVSGRMFSCNENDAPSACALPEDEIEALTDRLLEGDSARMQVLLSEAFGGPDMTLERLRLIGRQLFEALKARLDGQDSGVLESELDCEKIYHPDYLCSRLIACVQRVSDRLCSAEVSSAGSPGASDGVTAWIAEHYMEDISLESAADHFHVTSVHLSRWFKKENGINFSTYLSAFRIQKACGLIAENPALKNTELAAQVGFANVLTFTRQFKAQTELTPDQYRKQLQRGHDAVS